MSFECQKNPFTRVDWRSRVTWSSYDFFPRSPEPVKRKGYIGSGNLRFQWKAHRKVNGLVENWISFHSTKVFDFNVCMAPTNRIRFFNLIFIVLNNCQLLIWCHYNLERWIFRTWSDLVNCANCDCVFY